MTWNIDEYGADADPLAFIDGRLNEPVLRSMADALRREGVATAAELRGATNISHDGLYYTRDVPAFRDEVLPALDGSVSGGVTVDLEAAESEGLVDVTRYEEKDQIRVSATDALRERVVDLIDPSWGTRGSGDLLAPLAHGAEALYETLAHPSTPRLDPDELWLDHARYTGRRSFGSTYREYLVDEIVAALPGYSSAPLEFRHPDHDAATAGDHDDVEAPA